MMLLRCRATAMRYMLIFDAAATCCFIMRAHCFCHADAYDTALRLTPLACRLPPALMFTLFFFFACHAIMMLSLAAYARLAFATPLRRAEMPLPPPHAQQVEAYTARCRWLRRCCHSLRARHTLLLQASLYAPRDVAAAVVITIPLSLTLLLFRAAIARHSTLPLRRLLLPPRFFALMLPITMLR